MKYITISSIILHLLLVWSSLTYLASGIYASLIFLGLPSTFLTYIDTYKVILSVSKVICSVKKSNFIDGNEHLFWYLNIKNLMSDYN